MTDDAHAAHAGAMLAQAQALLSHRMRHQERAFTRCLVTRDGLVSRA